MLVAYLIEWVGDHLFSSDLWNPPFFHPQENVLAYSDHLIGLGVLALPLRFFLESPVLLINLISFTAFILTALAVYRWLLEFCRDELAALAAATTFTFSSWRVLQLSHPQLLFLPFLPLALLVYQRVIRLKVARRWLWVASALLTIQTLCTPSLSVYMIPLVIFWIGLEILFWKRFDDFRLWLNLAASLLILFFVNFLPARHYWQLASETGFKRTLPEIRSFSVHFVDWISSPRSHWLYGQWLDFTHGMERELFPGFIFAAIVLVGTASLLRHLSKQKRILGSFFLSTVMAIWASIGPSSAENISWLHWPYDLLYLLAPGGQGVRVPARFVLLVGFFVTPIVSLGWERLFKAVRGRSVDQRRAVVVGMLLMSFCLAESLPGFAFYDRLDEQPGTRWEAKDLRPKGLLFLPLPASADAHQEIDRMWTARRLGVPTVNGYSGYFSRPYENIRKLQQQEISRETARAFYVFLLQHGIDTIVLKSDSHPLVDPHLLKRVPPDIYLIPESLSLPTIERIRMGEGIGLLLPDRGWSYPEYLESDSWIWSMTAKPGMWLPVEAKMEGSLQLRARSIDPSSSQQTEVFFNGVSLGKRTLTHHPSFLSFNLPQGLVQPGWGELEFEGPPPRRPIPAEGQPQDPRNLGICLYEIRLQ